MSLAGGVGLVGSPSLIPPDPGTVFLGLEPQIIWFWGEWEESLVGWVPLNGYDVGGQGQL